VKDRIEFLSRQIECPDERESTCPSLRVKEDAALDNDGEFSQCRGIQLSDGILDQAEVATQSEPSTSGSITSLNRLSDDTHTNSGSNTYGKPLKPSLKSASAPHLPDGLRHRFRARSELSTLSAKSVYFRDEDGLEEVHVYNPSGRPANLLEKPIEETETETEVEGKSPFLRAAAAPAGVMHDYRAQAISSDSTVSAHQSHSAGPPMTTEPADFGAAGLSHVRADQASEYRRAMAHEPAFICELCGAAFTRKHNYDCTYRNLFCSVSHLVIDHLLAHSDVRPHYCRQPGCSSVFTRRWDRKSKLYQKFVRRIFLEDATGHEKACHPGVQFSDYNEGSLSHGADP
jgi:hypothetical protein